MAKAYFFLLILAPLFFDEVLSTESSKKAECEGRPLDVIFLVDINAQNITDFNKQRSRIIDVIRYLDKVSVGRNILYGIIAFHEYPNVLLSIVSPFASQSVKVVDYIKKLSIGTKFNSSPAQALELASQQFFTSNRLNSNKLVIVAHDGISVDLIDEALKARNNLKRIGATLFAITSTQKPNLPALIGYTTNREHVYATEYDRDIFFEKIREAIDRCIIVSESLRKNGNTGDTTLQEALHKAIRSSRTEKNQHDEKSILERACKANKVDMIIVLDSSGSVYNVFEDKRKLAKNLLSFLVPSTLEDGRVQVSVVRFSSTAEIAIPFKINRTSNEIIEKLDKIKFTGGNTRIAEAVNLAMGNLFHWRRNDAIQIMILISDGNGHEFWHVAQKAGRRLQSANIEIFAVPLSRDHNLNELALYTGDRERIYRGTEQNQFVRMISSFINKCVRANFSQKLIISSAEPKLNVIEKDITDVKSKTPTIQSRTEINGFAEQRIPKKLKITGRISSSAPFTNPSIGIIDIGGQPIIKQEGTRLLIKKKNTGKLEKNVKIISEFVENEQTVENITDKVIQISSLTTDSDLLFVIDLSPNSSVDLKNELKLAKELINKVNNEDINEKRIRIAVVTYTENVRLDLGWGQTITKAQILQYFDSIEYTASNSSAVIGITLATKYAQKARRPNARLIVVLFSNGGKQDQWNSVIQVSKKLHVLQETSIYAVTTSKQYTFSQLEAFTRNKWKVYVDGRIRRFVTDASKELIKKETDEHDEIIDRDNQSSSIIQSIQAHKDLVDFIILVDTSTAADEEFEILKGFLEEILQTLQAVDPQSRVRISLITFNDNAHIEIELRKPTTKENVLYAVERLENEYNNASVSTAVNVALLQIKKVPSEDPRRRIFVILTDGSTQDSTQTISRTAAKLEQTNAEVYVVPITSNYSKNELSLYAGRRGKLLNNVKGFKKNFTNNVHLDGNISVKKNFTETTKINQSLSEKITVKTLLSNQPDVTSEPNRIAKSISENPLSNFDLSSAEIRSKAQIQDPNCMVDLIFVVDKSQSVEKTFHKQLQYAALLIALIPQSAFKNHIKVAAISFSSGAEVNFQLNEFSNKTEILNALLSLKHSGGNTSSVNGINLAIKEIQERGRDNVWKMIVLISDGHGQDRWEDILHASDRLHATDAIIYAISADNNYYFRELESYTKNEQLVYVNNNEKRFLDDATISLLKCRDPTKNQTEVVTTTIVDKKTIKGKERKSAAASIRTIPNKAKQVNGNNENKKNQSNGSTDLLNHKSLESTRIAKSLEPKKCKYSKMDLEIILDASTSRQQVFEHQRELALSLIERLPIDAGKTHVAVGINSFTSVPTLRQTLGLGRDKQMVRHAIEDIKYNGGSTFTAQAVKLSVQDLERGRRPDAIQVVVLMNDGMSQDPWENVLEASQLLRATGAELFGVALGEKIDLRELKHYIGSSDRIYRDNSTERFLTDVVSLLTGGEECSIPASVNLENNKKRAQTKLNEQKCSTPNLDIIILFDNAIKKANLSEQTIFSNRYLLLDVLGSLPVTKRGPVKISVIIFNSHPQLVVSMSDLQDRDSIFNKVESIKPGTGNPSYATAINFAIQEYNKGHREDAHGILVIVGDGRSNDNFRKRDKAVKQLRAAKDLNKYAVDSSKLVNVEVLSKYTGSSHNVFNYDRNAEFAKIMINAVETVNKQCIQMSSHTAQLPTITTTSAIRSTFTQRKKNEERKKDIASKLNENLKRFDNDKVVIKEKTTTVLNTQISRSTTNSVNRQKITKEKFSRISKVENKNETLLVARNKTEKNEKQIKQISRSSRNPKISITQTTRSSNFHRQSTSTSLALTTTTTFSPGCEIDVIILIDSSGSVERAFKREKELAAETINLLRIGPNNARVAIIKFASKEKVKTIWSFDDQQEQQKVLQALEDIPFSSGTTAIHAALFQAIKEYSSAKGARPNLATPFVIIFTDGFGQKDITEPATSLRNLIPDIFAVAISSEHPVNEEELIKIAGSKDRIFMDSNIRKLFEILKKITKTC